MAIVYDGTANSLRDRVTDLEGEVFGPNGSAYRLHQKLTGVETIDAATVLSPGGGTARTLAEWMGDVVNVKAFGAKGDGTTDDTAAIQATFAAAAASFADVLIPPGSYRSSAQITLETPAYRRVTVRAYGAELLPDAGVSGLKITGGAPTGGAAVVGLKVNHRGNATAAAGFEIVQGWRASLVDCIVEAHGVSATYAGVLVRNTDPAVPDTGSFWTRIENLAVRKRSGSDTGDIAYGIVLRGASNATSILGGNLGNVTTGLRVEVDSGQTYLSNAVLVDGVAFEGYGTAISVNGAATSNVAGHRFVNNRFENGATVFSYTGTTAQPSSPPVASGNYLVSNAGTYLENPNGLYFNGWDTAVTPAISPAIIANDFTVRAVSGSAWPIVLRSQGAGRGMRLLRSDGVQVAAFTWSGPTASDNGADITATTGGVANLTLKGVKGISGAGGTTQPNNLRGAATFASAGTRAVTFLAAEPDASYYLALSVGADERIWVTDKTAAGFTLNSSNATSTAVVDWIVIR